MKEIGMQYQCLHFTILSGNSNNGVNAGAFYWNLNNGSSNANRNIGAQLAIVETRHRVPCPIGRICQSNTAW